MELGKRCGNSKKTVATKTGDKIMKKNTNFLIFTICFYCAFMFLSCSNTRQKVAPIKIGINEWTGYDPFILADKTDLFKKNNVQVEIIRYATATEEMQAMKDGKIHGAGFTLDEVFSLIESGFKCKVVLIVDYSMGGDMIIGQKDIKSIAELNGKTIGYEGTVVGEFLLDRALYMNFVRKSSVKLVDVQADNWLYAFKEKSMDALVCFNPVATTLLNEEKGNLLFSSAEMPFEIIDVLIFSESFYENNKAAITNILKAWFDALTYLNTDTDKAAEVISSVKNISPEKYKLGLKGLIVPNLKVNKTVLDSKSDKNIYKYSQVIVNFMLSKGLLSNRINTTDLFQSEIIFGIEGQTKKQEIKK
jgi:NitT/TauT family transport system substrate-binding protein